MEQIQPSNDRRKSSLPHLNTGSFLNPFQTNPTLPTFPGSKLNNSVISPLLNCNSKSASKPFALSKCDLDIACHTSSPSIYSQNNHICLSSTNHSGIFPSKHKSGLQRLLGYRYSYFPKLTKKSDNSALRDSDFLHPKDPRISNDIDSDYFSLIDSTFTFENFVKYCSTATSDIRRSSDSFNFSEKELMTPESNVSPLEETKQAALNNTASSVPEIPDFPYNIGSGSFLNVPPEFLTSTSDSQPRSNGPPSIQPIPPKKEQDPKSYLRYLEDTFSRTEIGSLISKKDEFHTQVLEVFMDSLSFKDVSIDMALRNLVSILYLPKEGQQIDRIIAVFSKRYYEANKKLFSSEDVVYSLSFSILLLHTDAHNKLVKRKMTKKEYVKQAQQIDAASIPEEILEILYDNITTQEFFRSEELFESPLSKKTDNNKQTWFQKWYDPNRGIALKHNQIQSNHTNTAVKVSTFFGPFRPDKPPFSFCSPLHIHNKKSHSVPFKLQVKGLITNFHQNFKEGPTSGFSYSGINEVSDITELKCHSEGFVLRKSDIKDSGRKSHLRIWREFWAVLSGSQLLLFKEVSYMRLRQHALDQIFIAPKPYSVTSISNGISLIDHEYTKHDNVFRFVTSDERQYLFRVESHEAKLEWMSKINFLASFSSISICPRKSFCSMYGTESPINLGSDIENNQVSTIQKLNNAIYLLNAPIQNLQKKIDDDIKLLHQISIMVVFTKHTRDRVLQNIDRIKLRLRQNHLESQRLLCYKENLLTYLNFSTTSNFPKLSHFSSGNLSKF